MLSSVHFLPTVDEMANSLFKEDNEVINKNLIENAELRLTTSKKFLTLFQQKKVWQTMYSVSFLNHMIHEFEQKKNEIITSLESINTSYTPHTMEKIDKDAMILQEAMKEQKQRRMICLQKELAAWEQHIRDYQDSLLERKIALEIVGENYQFPEKSNLELLAIRSFAHALIILKVPKFATSIRTAELINLLHLYQFRGKHHTAGIEFAHLVLNEALKRVEQGTLSIDNPIVSQLKAFAEKKDLIHPFVEKLKMDHTQLKAQAFIKIYTELREAQKSFMKTNYLEGKETWTAEKLLDHVKQYAKDFDLSRTAKAWKLTQKYYQSCLENNEALADEINEWSSSKSSLFCQATTYAYSYFFAMPDKEEGEAQSLPAHKTKGYENK